MKQITAILLRVHDLRRELGPTGLAALVLLGATALFFALVVKPMQAKNESLAASLSRQARVAPGTSAISGDKLAAVYSYLDKQEETTDWFAKLYAIGKATGVEMKAGNYRQKAEGVVQHTEVVLPLTGSYSQIRDFMQRALSEIPVLSLDQVTLKRQNRTDGTLQAELRLTLHQVKK